MVTSSQRAKASHGESTLGKFLFIKLDMPGECSFYGAGFNRLEGRHLINWWANYEGNRWWPHEKCQSRDEVIVLIVKATQAAAILLKARITFLGGKNCSGLPDGVKIDIY